MLETTRTLSEQNSVESMNENTFVAIMPSTGHLLQVDDDRCYGCAACIMVCPVDALNLRGWLVEVDHATCTLCDHCLPSCPVDALHGAVVVIVVVGSGLVAVTAAQSLLIKGTTSC
ncbi:MAG: hypothetical protein CM15mP18_1790 [Methanobacteriota archaeon]|nr:MAG: hypothetical protein CM15mP18_1790 [Euryarchaeota archaeon]